jgi:hypothetical protein
MPPRNIRNIAFLLLAAAIPASAAGDFLRDWKAYPAVIERRAPETIYAIGDIHGDYNRLVRLLVAAHIVPAAPAKPGAVQWSAGASTLVVTGDMIDKGPRPVDVLRLLTALEAAARPSKGEVILLAGNHEAEFVAGPDKKKAADFIADLERNRYVPTQVARCQGDIGLLFCNLPYAARVGDWFFSHAGSTDGRTLDQISTDIQSGVHRNGFATEALVAPDSLLEARLGEGKTWFVADPKHDAADAERRLLAANAKALGVSHIVQGHQHGEVKFADGVERHAGEIFQRWGLLFLIDVGMSEGIGDSQGAALRIAGGKAVAICPNGEETPLWPADVARAICKAR